MSITPNLCCDETKNRGTYTRVTIIFLLFGPCFFNLFQRFLPEGIRAISRDQVKTILLLESLTPSSEKGDPEPQDDPPFQTPNHRPYPAGSSQRDTTSFSPYYYEFKVWNEGDFGAQKRKQQSQRPLLNHLTSEKTKQNFKSCPNAPGCLHLSGAYYPLSRNLPPPTPAQKTYHSLPNYKCYLN